ncbi:MAG TPA: YdcF family protein [Bacteroidia bacterium]|jgi:uncharacterized SAM-binding protein YcdF (DUF218 family)|nr:YdcF family protein [Bacteroidia bacterium]
MFFLISKLLSFIITPVVWVAALLLVAIITKNALRRKRFLIAGFIVFYVFTNDFLLDTFMRIWEVPAIHDEEIQGKYDVGIVLGGMIEYDDQLKRPQFKQGSDRLFQALTLYHKGKIRKILIDGGSGSLTEKDMREGPILKTYLLQQGIPDSVIAIEPNSKNTHENALFAKPILDSLAPHGKYILVTSGYHMRRAYKCFEKVGIHTLAFSTDRYAGPPKFVFDYAFIPDVSALIGWDALLHEWVGYITYKVSGYM